jgi:hypothetical protein
MPVEVTVTSVSTTLPFASVVDDAVVHVVGSGVEVNVMADMLYLILFPGGTELGTGRMVLVDRGTLAVLVVLVELELVLVVVDEDEEVVVVEEVVDEECVEVDEVVVVVLDVVCVLVVVEVVEEHDAKSVAVAWV